MVGNNLRELILNVLGLDGVSTKSGEHTSSKTKTRKLAMSTISQSRRLFGSSKDLLKFPLLDEETRALGKAEKADSQNDGPEQLDGDRDTVGRAVGARLRGVGNAGCQHETECHAELVARDNGTTHLAGSNLRHVSIVIGISI